jgi:hypothetical protein
MNSERKVIDEIDQLVNESLAAPITDDYSVNRYERCELCRNDWHGLPTMDDYLDRSCPGAWASDEAKAAWREMFPAPAAPRYLPSPPFESIGRLGEDVSLGWTERIVQGIRGTRLSDAFTHSDWQRFAGVDFDRRWQFTNAGRAAIFSGHIDFGSDTFRVRLLSSEDDELPEGGGYATGGLPVSLAVGRPNPDTVVVSFAANPVWIATGSGFSARHAGLVDRDTVIAHCQFDWVHVSRGNTLTIDGDGCPNPLFKLTGIL